MREDNHASLDLSIMVPVDSQNHGDVYVSVLSSESRWRWVGEYDRFRGSWWVAVAVVGRKSSRVFVEVAEGCYSATSSSSTGPSAYVPSCGCSQKPRIALSCQVMLWSYWLGVTWRLRLTYYVGTAFEIVTSSFNSGKIKEATMDLDQKQMRPEGKYQGALRSMYIGRKSTRTIQDRRCKKNFHK